MMKPSTDNPYLKKVATVESGNKNDAKNPNSSAVGKYQFIESTWNSLVNKYNLGYTLDDRKDPKKADKVMQLFTYENEKVIKPILGREINDADRYLTHFLGTGGATKLFKTMNANPNAPISSVMSPEALRANKGVVYNKDGSLKTVGDVYNWATKKMNIKTDFSNFEETKTSPTFVDVVHTQYGTDLPQIKEEKKDEVETAKEEIKQKTAEKTFLEDLKNNRLYEQPQEEEEQYTQPQEPQKSTLQSFAEIESFVENPLFRKGGEKNSLWKNIRENRGSGKKPTKEMLEQERKIKNSYEEGGQIPISRDGVFASGGKPVIVPSPSIDMSGVNYPILGISTETGERKMMMPDQNYFFKNTANVLEIPLKNK